MLGPVLAGSGVHDYHDEFTSIRRNYVYDWRLRGKRVRVRHGSPRSFLLFRHGDFTRSIAAAILFSNAVNRFVSQHKKCTYRISIVE